MDLTEKLREMSEHYANTEELTDKDRYKILATLTTDSASSLTISSDGKIVRLISAVEYGMICCV